jgi:DNA-binding NarL/FixJ family response regulator
MNYEIGIVDDHCMFLKCLGSMITDSFDNFTVTMEAGSCMEMKTKLQVLHRPPDIILLDVNMPGVNGIETAKWLTENSPAIKLVALTMNNTDSTIFNMISAGCCSYILKNAHPNELENSLQEIAIKGFCNADSSNINFRKLMDAAKKEAGISEKEREFLPYVGTDLTYKQIAAIMGVTERTIDGYRESLFAKLQVQSRQRLAVEILRRGWVEL